MKTGFFLRLASLAFVFISCSAPLPQDEAGDATGVKSATLPASITPFESLPGVAVDAKAFDRFGAPFNPRAEGQHMYVAAGIFFVKTKLTAEKNAKMANILVFEEDPAPTGVLTVQTKINGNKCFSYAFDAELFAGRAFWAENGTSVRYEFSPADVSFDAVITLRTDDDPEDFTVPAGMQ